MLSCERQILSAGLRAAARAACSVSTATAGVVGGGGFRWRAGSSKQISDDGNNKLCRWPKPRNETMKPSSVISRSDAGQYSPLSRAQTMPRCSSLPLFVVAVLIWWRWASSVVAGGVVVLGLFLEPGGRPRRFGGSDIVARIIAV